MPIDFMGESAAIQFLNGFNISDGAISLPGGFRLSVTTFTQALGAELLTNGAVPIAFTGDDPDGWTVADESGTDPEVSEVGTGEGHGGSGTGWVNLFTSAEVFKPVILQAIFTAHEWYEIQATIDTIVAGGVQFLDQSAVFVRTHTTTGTKAAIARLGNTQFRARSSAASSNVTLGNLSAKLVTLNTIYETVSDGRFEFFFTLPGSPIAGEEVHLLYRRLDFRNYWDLYLRRNAANDDWDMRLDRIFGGTINNHLNVTGVGTPTGLRVDVAGSIHTPYTFASGTYTQRGGSVTNSNFNTATGVVPIYQSSVTPVELHVVG